MAPDGDTLPLDGIIGHATTPRGMGALTKQGQNSGEMTVSESSERGGNLLFDSCAAFPYYEPERRRLPQEFYDRGRCPKCHAER